MYLSNSLRHLAQFLFLVLFLFITLTTVSMAQSVTVDTGVGSSVQLPDPLTSEAVNKMVSRLSDKEVRDLLLERLEAVAQKEAASEGSNKSSIAVARDLFVGVGDTVVIAVAKLSDVGGGVSGAFSRFLDGRGFSGFLLFLLKLAISIGLGLAAGWIVNWLTRSLQERFQNEKSEGLWETVKLLLIRFGLDLIKVVAFSVISLGVNRFIQSSPGDVEFAGRFIKTIMINVLIFAAIARLIFAPQRAALRLVSVDDYYAKALSRSMVTIAILMGLGPFLVFSLQQYGNVIGELRVGFWTNLILHLFIMWSFYRLKGGVVQACKGNDDLMGPLGIKFAELFPYIAMGLVACNWILTQMLVGAGRFDLLQGQQFVTLGLILFTPMLDTGLRGLVHHLTPPLQGEGVIAERAHLASERAYLRMGRVLFLALVMLLLAKMWGVDVFNTSSADPTERLVAKFVDGMLFFFLGYVVWEAAGLWINQRLAQEHTAAGLDGEEQELGGEGGGAGATRIATVLPILKLVLLPAILIMTVLLGLSRLGVDITPLLAGAGIIGLAIGFGAQTLVKDIVSGVFFLIDDAFRVGEYLVVGNTVGTVEKISIRSLQLRHHNGPVHTIPYGEIPTVTNNSRDWVITKIKFTFPHGTDVNKIKKIFKKVGADLLEGPQADDIIQTFKSQGVARVDDAGIVVGSKFMAKPGTQWMIRKDIYNRVQAGLDEAGIEYARKSVRVDLSGVDKPEDLTEEQKNTIAAAASEAAEPKPA